MRVAVAGGRRLTAAADVSAEIASAKMFRRGSRRFAVGRFSAGCFGADRGLPAE